jgi:channel protein (hemolysin III family)
MQNSKPQSKVEEGLNGFSHLVASIFFLFLAFYSKDLRGVTYCAVFSLMFMSSTIYHLTEKHKVLFRAIDQMFIYVVIGATTILATQSLTNYQMILIISVLSLTILHHAIRAYLSIPEGFTVPLLYLFNGSLCGYFMLKNSESMNFALITGLSTYIVGFFFYLNDHRKYFHFAWHVTCIAGAFLVFVYVNSLG